METASKTLRRSYPWKKSRHLTDAARSRNQLTVPIEIRVGDHLIFLFFVRFSLRSLSDFSVV